MSSRKCQIVKELSNPEIVQMPFVTESFKISLIVPVQEKHSQKVTRVGLDYVTILNRIRKLNFKF